MNEDIIFTTEDVNQNKVYGILAYLGILFLVPLFGAKDSLYAKFHANQGLVLFIFEVIVWVSYVVISFVLGLVTFGLMNIVTSFIVAPILGLIMLAFIIIGIVNACSGEAKKLPIIGGITLLK